MNPITDPELSPSTIPDEEGVAARFWSAVWAVSAAFGCYFCMYAFRKPFTAAAYQDTELWGIDFKTILVTSQVAGYMVSKFLGIKLVTETPPERRAVFILKLIAAAEVALVLFAVVPRPWNAICLFLNGLPLGMVFGLVLGFLEGRRLTEALTAGLCASFILADGVVKSVGAFLLTLGVTEAWMPAVAGAIFLAPIFGCVQMLARIQPPDRKDIDARSQRVVMNRNQRQEYLFQSAAGLFPIVLMFLLVTILRSIRADFAREIWTGLGNPAPPEVFTTTEIFVALGVLVVNGACVLIRDNRVAFQVSLATCVFGFLILGGTLIGQSTGALSPFAFMTCIGLGLYLPYVAVHTTVFERLLAMQRGGANIAFLMYVADAIGYLGYVVVMLARNFFYEGEGNVLGLLVACSWITVVISIVSLIISIRYYWNIGVTTAPSASSEFVQ